jgi:hypothetical protein
MYASRSLYPYDPNKPLPIIFAAIIFVLGLILFYRSWRHKWYHFLYAMAFASLVWQGGFIARSVSVFQPNNIPVFLTQYVMIFAGPPLFAASEYFILGRLLSYLPYHAPLHPDRVLSTFLILGAVVEALGTSGIAAIAAPNIGPAARTSAIARAGAALILQFSIEVLFFSMVFITEWRCQRAGRCPHNVRIVCRVLYLTSLMMMLRCGMRIAESFEGIGCDPQAPGYDGYCGSVQTKEWYLWVFEAGNIALFVTILAVWHPSSYLPADSRQYLDPTDSTTERVGPGYASADQRSWFTTVMDPFNWMGSWKGVKTLDRFWERDHPIAATSFAEIGDRSRDLEGK